MNINIRKRGCGVIVLDSNKKILMGQRVKSGDNMEWCLPGGSYEPNENLYDAPIREVKEECGLDVDIMDIHFIAVKKNGDWDDHVFVATKTTGSVSDNTEEMINFKYFTMNQIKELAEQNKLYPATILAIDAYLLASMEVGKQW